MYGASQPSPFLVDDMPLREYLEAELAPADAGTRHDTLTRVIGIVAQRASAFGVDYEASPGGCSGRPGRGWLG